MNGDGILDFISGSYATKQKFDNKEYNFKGHLQIAYGKAGETKGEFSKPEILKNKDGNFLILDKATKMAAGGGSMDRCTHQTMADLNGDGAMEIYIGGLDGYFYAYDGENIGKKRSFGSKGYVVQDDAGKPLKGDKKSAPFFVDWDGDGDLDLLSGSESGAVYWAENIGDKTNPKWKKMRTIFEKSKAEFIQYVIDGKSVRGPNSKVWAGDINNDGKLDLLVSDRIFIRNVRAGFTREQVDQKLAGIKKMAQELANYRSDKDSRDQVVRKEIEKRNLAISAEYHKFLHSGNPKKDSYGRVWVYLGK